MQEKKKYIKKKNEKGDEVNEDYIAVTVRAGFHKIISS